MHDENDSSRANLFSLLSRFIWIHCQIKEARICQKIFAFVFDRTRLLPDCENPTTLLEFCGQHGHRTKFVEF